ncbi:O-methyltransferase [Schaalia sp. 19OD2882]|uniref:O-methyltransferase n=1 Tax=Schaalia sp. 19OD2882 TaxID=2794089 RepID=UPI001C1EF678|nr:O-methyltransferase [Schaalia sp. 19OD2882]QWW20071.1 O-methyltransferase [Schaalia sp. 19OD2882]
MAADKAQSWVYSEDFVAESELITSAREIAVDLGAAPVSTGTGAALRMLAAVSGARAVLEIGTGAGVSGLWLLDGMPADGVLTTIDHEVEFQKHARRAYMAAGVSTQRTRLIAGRALDVLPRMAAGGYDMMVIDGDVMEAPDYVEHALRVVRPGGVIALVHALWHDQVADPARRDSETVVCRELIRFLRSSGRFVPTLLPVGDGLAVAIKR